MTGALAGPRPLPWVGENEPFDPVPGGQGLTRADDTAQPWIVKSDLSGETNHEP